jgi:glycosyltransferase involved in cell wall biosynthesis
MNHKNTGVSVILCCYNSVNRIEATLKALAQQQSTSLISWEIVAVDNASTDGTSGFIQKTWDLFGKSAPLKIVHEPQPGLAHARNKGLSEASFDVVIFCDDDNWLAPFYIFNAATIMQNDPQIAACGGLGTPIFENGIKPYWFDVYAEAYATGPQHKGTEKGILISLYGAGLVLRKGCITQLNRAGFKPLLTGRTGKKLSSAEDTELMYAFVLAGYKLHYSDELQFQHFLPQNRLNRNYLKKLFIAFGTDGPVRNLYYAAITRRLLHRQLAIWPLHLLLAVIRLFKYLLIPPKKYGRTVYFHWSISYIKELISMRKSYSEIWNKISELKNNNIKTSVVPMRNMMTQKVVNADNQKSKTAGVNHE